MTEELTNYQRKGVISNAHAGRDFEEAARLYFEQTGIILHRGFEVPIGYRLKKNHKFDLGSKNPPIIVECKSYTWTKSGKSPSAKIRGLNEVMLHFSLAPRSYRKILFILRHMRKEISLGTHYIQTQGHLIGGRIEIWEFNLDTKQAAQLHPSQVY
jgi:hypothetical protein